MTFIKFLILLKWNENKYCKFLEKYIVQLDVFEVILFNNQTKMQRINYLR